MAQIQAVDSELRAARLVAGGTESEVEFGLKTLLDLLDAEHDLSSAELRFASSAGLDLNGYNLVPNRADLFLNLPRKYTTCTRLNF